jgi:hypothetical protein
MGKDSRGMSASQDAERRSESHPPSTGSAFQDRLEALFRRAAEGASNIRRPERLLGLLTVVALLAGMLLIVCDFVTLFQIKLRSTVVEEPTGGDQHSYAVAVMGAAIVGAALLARVTEAWPPAAAVAGLGVAALAIALLGDLPDATRSDLVRGGRIGEASPALGFWLELAGAVIALSVGLALAYLLRRSADGQDTPRRTPEP